MIGREKSLDQKSKNCRGLCADLDPVGQSVECRRRRERVGHTEFITFFPRSEQNSYSVVLPISDSSKPSEKSSDSVTFESVVELTAES